MLGCSSRASWTNVSALTPSSSGTSLIRAADTIGSFRCRTCSASPSTAAWRGYEDTNDAERLAEDPTFRMLASRERRETSVALTSTLHRFETEVLAEERNYEGLGRLNAALIQHASTRSPTGRVTLDIDSSESPVHGAQEQAAYNGYFESVCYHPLFVTQRVTASRRSSGRAMSTVRTGGTTSSSPSLTGTARSAGPSSSARMRRSPCPPSMRPWSGGG
jgi:hypothetical protein